MLGGRKKGGKGEIFDYLGKQKKTWCRYETFESNLVLKILTPVYKSDEPFDSYLFEIFMSCTTNKGFN